MRNFKLIALAALVALFVSCKNNDDGDGGGNNNDPTNPNLENHFSCKINGEEWTANGVDQPTVTRLGNADAPLNQLDFFLSCDLKVRIKIYHFYL